MIRKASPAAVQNQLSKGLDIVPAKRHLPFIIVMTAALATAPALAQKKNGAKGKKADAGAVKTSDIEKPSTDGKEKAGDQQAQVLKRLETLEQKTAAMSEENEDLKARLAKQEEESAQEKIEGDDDLTARLEMLENAEFERIQAKEMELKIYGFADVQWYKFFYDDDTRYQGQLNDMNSFTVGHWHVYLEKRLSEHFRFLGEVRFLFQPLGTEINYTGSDFYGEQTQYERYNTETWDWVDAYYFDWGGIAIQRLWIEYKYSDVFGVRVGNFLTPYGIWNVDHASTVVIPGHRPFIITAQLLPESQTGLNFFGRFFPSDKTSIDYALTLTNGRGPVSKVYDVDENKAVGLSLSFLYDGPLSLNLGTYLFFGEYTEIERSMLSNPDMIFDYDVDEIENYLEMTMAFHLKLEWSGLLLQGEYVGGIGKYKDGGRIVYQEPSETNPGAFSADFRQWAAYGLIAYRLPFEAVNLSPYFIYEYQAPRETEILPRGHNLGGGLNWRITPTVVWKIEVFFHREDGPFWGIPKDKNHYGNVNSQLAVSY